MSRFLALACVLFLAAVSARYVVRRMPEWRRRFWRWQTERRLAKHKSNSRGHWAA